ncbi:MAG: peptide chain release factor 2 [Alphaproteobacteria bacterium]|nr:peptide chain release factor 2 [Alphaproteobacteria bacterium]
MRLKIEAIDGQLLDTQNDYKQIAELHRERKRLNDSVVSLESLVSRHKMLKELIDIIDGEDAGIDDDIKKDWLSDFKDFFDKLEKFKITTLFTGSDDESSAFVDINAGAGGTEACDWVSMLARMYSKWATENNFITSIVSSQNGEVAGYRSITLEIKGGFAFGWLKFESGVHRLVRISPFDSKSKRHTSFAGVKIYADNDKNTDITILAKDIKIDTFRSSGAGGQSVQKTNSAVRITHLSTNIVVQCQNERSQIQNKEFAMKMLKAKLYDLETSKKSADKHTAFTEESENEWGSQIRSYILQPYQLVKDYRSNFESSNTTAILDGNITELLIKNLEVL